MANRGITELQQTPQRDDELRRLGRLVGTWNVAGGVRGQIAFEWLEGGSCLMQRVDLEHDGRRVRGIAVIGREWPFGGASSSEDIRSRFYSEDGETLDHVYELEGDTLTIWVDEKGSAAYCKAELCDGGETLFGASVWPGGGYEFTGTRVTSTRHAVLGD